jgi:CRP-like cAMP-binding protein
MTDDSASKVTAFFDQYKLRTYSKGQVLIFDDDDAHYVFHLVSGRVKMYDTTYRGDEVILNIFKPPAFFPMSLAINRTHNPYIYEAETIVEAHQAPADEVVAFLQANPDVTFDLLSRLYKGVDGLLGRMAHLMGGSAKSRLAYELVVECRRFGKEQKDGSCLLHITEVELAARAGLSRETVSREIQKLLAAGYITSETKGLRISDVAVLERELGAHL